MKRPVVTLTTVDPVLTIADVCRVLKLSPSQFHALTPKLRAMGLLEPIVPALDGRTRFAGAPIAAWLSEDHQRRARARQLQEAI